jgi:hypothetical protein
VATAVCCASYRKPPPTDRGLFPSNWTRSLANTVYSPSRVEACSLFLLDGSPSPGFGIRHLQQLLRTHPGSYTTCYSEYFDLRTPSAVYKSSKILLGDLDRAASHHLVHPQWQQHFPVKYLARPREFGNQHQQIGTLELFNSGWRSHPSYITTLEPISLSQTWLP